MMHSDRRRLLAACCVVALATPRAAIAMTNIEAVQWGLGCSGGSLYLLGRATSTDIAQGVRFSIQERSPGGNDLLTDVALPWTGPYPPVGTEVRVFLDVQLSSAGSRLTGGPITRWHLSWCSPPSPIQVRGSANGAGATVGVGTSHPEPAHEFVLVDENGVEGANPSPEDMVCGPGKAVAPVLDLPSPYELVARGKSITDETASQIAGLDRRDPTLLAEPTGSIGVYFDTQAADVCGISSIGVPITMYVIAMLAGATACGITGAELRIATIPSGWLGGASIPPNAISIGDPLGPVGGVMAFTTCQGGGSVLLYTISLFPTTTVVNHPIDVLKRNPPTNGNFQCPLITLCDNPQYTIACVERGPTAFINPSSGNACGLVAIESRTWGSVKRLYE